MQTGGTHTSRGMVTFALCFLLAGGGAWGCASDAATSGSGNDSTAPKDPVVTIVEIDPEVDDADAAPDQTDESKDHTRLSSCLGSIAKGKDAADEYGNPVVERKKVQELFELTIEDEKFELPCPITAFVEKGWAYEQGYTFGEARYDPGFEYEVQLWYETDARWNLTVKARNTTDEVCEWDDLTVVGVTLRPLDSYIGFESAIGVDRDSDLDELLEVLGCNTQSTLLENKTIVEYHVSLYDKPLKDDAKGYGDEEDASLYADVSYDWNKTGKAMTSISLELLEPWDTDLRLTDEELAEKREAEAVDADADAAV